MHGPLFMHYLLHRSWNHWSKVHTWHVPVHFYIPSPQLSIRGEMLLPPLTFSC